MRKGKRGNPPIQGGESPFQRFEELAKKVVSVPKEKTKKDGKPQSRSSL